MPKAKSRKVSHASLGTKTTQGSQDHLCFMLGKCVVMEVQLVNYGGVSI